MNYFCVNVSGNVIYHKHRTLRCFHFITDVLLCRRGNPMTIKGLKCKSWGADTVMIMKDISQELV